MISKCKMCGKSIYDTQINECEECYQHFCDDCIATNKEYVTMCFYCANVDIEGM